MQLIAIFTKECSKGVKEARARGRIEGEVMG
jgi:hypothetical protein